MCCINMITVTVRGVVLSAILLTHCVMASSFPPRCKCVPQQTQAYQALTCNQAHEDQTQNQTGGSEPRLAEEADCCFIFNSNDTIGSNNNNYNTVVVLVVRHKHKKRSEQIGTSSAHDSLCFFKFCLKKSVCATEHDVNVCHCLCVLTYAHFSSNSLCRS